MATSKAPETAAATTGITASSIAQSGEGLIRLWVAAITLPLTAANALGTTFSRIVSSVTAALDGSPMPQSNSDVVKATNDLVKATTGLYTSMLSMVVSSLDSATKAINTAVADATKPAGK